jgi:hypothetical protein
MTWIPNRVVQSAEYRKAKGIIPAKKPYTGFAPAFLLCLMMVLVACGPKDVPDIPQDDGPTRLEDTPPCGTPRIELTEPRVIGEATVATAVRFTCQEEEPGSCGIDSCVPCWQRRGHLFVLTCVCEGLCGAGGFERPPTPEGPGG